MIPAKLAGVLLLVGCRLLVSNPKNRDPDASIYSLSESTSKPGCVGGVVASCRNATTVVQSAIPRSSLEAGLESGELASDPIMLIAPITIEIGTSIGGPPCIVV